MMPRSNINHPPHKKETPEESSLEREVKQKRLLDLEEEDNKEKMALQSLVHSLVTQGAPQEDIDEIQKSIIDLETQNHENKSHKQDSEKKENNKQTKKEFIQQFLTEYNLEGDLPPEFENLPEDNKLFVVQNLKRRVVDIVKTNAETQYSEDLKKKVVSSQSNKKLFGRMIDKVKNLPKQAWKGLGSAAYKQTDLKNIESKIFKEFKTSGEGQKLIAKDLQSLMRSVENKTILYDKKEGFIISHVSPKEIEHCTPEEQKAITRFNAEAHKFGEMPYEWGQGKGFFNIHKRKYENAEKQYKKARAEILNIKAKRENPEGKGRNILEIAKLDSAIRMEQLLNTHPEFEQEFNRLAEEAGIREGFKTMGIFVNTVTGKTWTNRALMLFGAGVRMQTRALSMASSATGIGALYASVAGATIGSLRGYFKARDILTQKNKEATRGKDKIITGKIVGDIAILKAQAFEAKKATNKDGLKEIEKSIKELEKQLAQQKESKLETRTFVDIVHLTEQLEKAMIRVNEARDTKEKEVAFAMLAKRIDHSMGKMDFAGSEVNFGKTESILGNQFDYIDTLNQAIILKESNKGLIDIKTLTTIYTRLSTKSETIEKDIQTDKSKFITKQMWQGAKIGAGAATFGYVARWFGEEMGWLGHHAENAQAKVPNTTKIEETGSNQPIENSAGIPPVNQVTMDSLAKVKAADSLRIIQENKNIDTTNIPITTTEDKIAETKGDILEKLRSPEHGATREFSVTLGVEGVPKNLETVFHEISADHLDLPADGMVNEEIATKSLNMAANMVELSKGHGILGINPDDFAKAVHFDHSTGVLEIKDHVKFNEIVDELKGKADTSWDSGVLQSKGAAISHIQDIHKESWVDIMKAKGLVHTPDGTATGIEGHPGVTLDKIINFENSTLVKAASIAQISNPGLEELTPVDTTELPKIEGLPPKESMENTTAPRSEERTNLTPEQQEEQNNTISNTETASPLNGIDARGLKKIDSLDSTTVREMNTEATQNDSTIISKENIDNNTTTYTVPGARPFDMTGTRQATAEDVLSLDTVQKDQKYLGTVTQIKEYFGPSNIVTEKPAYPSVDGINHTEWNTRADTLLFQQKILPINSYEEYQKEKELQLLFNYATRQEDMEYFRTTPEWNIVSKIPAKYFLEKNIHDITLLDGRHISEDDITILEKKGILINNSYSTSGGLPRREYTFTHYDQLKKLSKIYEKLFPRKELRDGYKPFPREGVEEYIKRLTQKVYQAHDGTLYGFKKDISWDQAVTRAMNTSQNVSHKILTDDTTDDTNDQ